MKNIDCKNLKIAYIGGGSRSWARTFMTDLALEEALGGEIRLYDIDEDAAKGNEIIGNRISNGKWKYITSPSLQSALTDADFVVISILPGTFKEMRSDVHTPERLGIYQSVGDTTGPGGIIRALRTVPLFIGFAKAIKEHCPDAWVINYTNPLALCVRALYDGFPEIKAFGCCHEVFGTQELLAEMIRRKFGITDVARSDINVNVLGINHFTWFNSASWYNYDLMDMYRDFTNEFYETGFSHGNSNMPDKCFTSVNRVKFDLFRKYGLIAAAGDRHLAEFMGDVYLKNPETAESWGFYLTSVDWREADLKNKLEKSTRLISGEESPVMKPSGEEGILLVKALCGLERVISNVNLPNTAGQTENLSRDVVAETNAFFSFNSIKPLHVGRIPENIFALIKPHADNQTEILRAAVNCDRNAVYRAFGNDSLIKGRCSDKELRDLADEMITDTTSYLPDGWR